MIQKLISLLIAGLVLFLIYVVVGLIVHGIILQIIGIILVLIFLVYVLQVFNLPPPAGPLLLICALCLTGCVAPAPYYRQPSVGVSFTPGFGAGYYGPVYRHHIYERRRGDYNYRLDDRSRYGRHHRY